MLVHPYPHISTLPYTLATELIDEAIATRITAVMNGDFEFTGLLKGFDDFVNMVLEDVTETYVSFSTMLCLLYVSFSLATLSRMCSYFCLLLSLQSLYR